MQYVIGKTDCFETNVSKSILKGAPPCSQFDCGVVSVHRAEARISSVPPATSLANDTADAERGNGEQNKHGDAKHSKRGSHLHDRTLEVTLMLFLLHACDKLLLMDVTGQSAQIFLKSVKLEVKFGPLLILVILDLRHD